jgi:magnesium chelatase accessory protein
MPALDWNRDGRRFPHHDACRFVSAAGLRWLVLEMGEGPTIALIHGTGASVHSWRHLAPLLAQRFRVVAMDLPGHGFTERHGSAQSTLPGMARGVAALLDAIGARPVAAIGHSAGAAVAIRMALDAPGALARIVSLNGALLPFGGVAGRVFAPIARALTLNPFVPALFAWRMRDEDAFRRVLMGTGSRLDAEGEALYARLAASPAHVSGALAMMANWDLDALKADLPRLRTPLTLVAAGNDRTIDPGQARAVKAIVPGAEVVAHPRRGHLSHEEAPEETMALLEPRLTPLLHSVAEGA